MAKRLEDERLLERAWMITCDAQGVVIPEFHVEEQMRELYLRDASFHAVVHRLESFEASEKAAVTRLLEIAADRWSSNPEIVMDEVRRFASKIIPNHPLIKAQTLREEKAALECNRFVVVDKEARDGKK